MMRFRVIVFDFDGTLVDSNALKRQAYDHAFADCPECLRALPGLLEQLKSQSRSEIIKALVDDIDELTVDERLAETKSRTEAYSAWVEARILERVEESPIQPLLERWRRHAALYVCSLTPTEPLRRILEKAGWLDYFAGVEGYPVSKADMLLRAMCRHGVRSDEALMVGDADSDEAAAKSAGTAFFRVREIPDVNRLDQFLRT